MMGVVWVLVLALVAAPAAAAERSAAARAAFQRAHPCPATGQPRGPCPGWVVDHVVPLCAGGADRPENMQWQTVEAARRKDVEERRGCRAAGRSDLSPQGPSLDLPP